MREDMSGEFTGLGIEVTMEEEVVKVVSPYDESPAAKAGILANDLIVEIDGVAVMGQTGVGKSTFISLCTGQKVQIGDSLKSCKSFELHSVDLFLKGTRYTGGRSLPLSVLEWTDDVSG